MECITKKKSVFCEKYLKKLYFCGVVFPTPCFKDFGRG